MGLERAKAAEIVGVTNETGLNQLRDEREQEGRRRFLRTLDVNPGAGVSLGTVLPSILIGADQFRNRYWLAPNAVTGFFALDTGANKATHLDAKTRVLRTVEVSSTLSAPSRTTGPFSRFFIGPGEMIADASAGCFRRLRSRLRRCAPEFGNCATALFLRP